MEPLHIHFVYERHANDSLLDDTARQLLNACKSAMERAYAPYSNFYVGAALQLENGNIIEGNNQENAAYPSGLCAERVAIFAAGANFPSERIMAIAITASSAAYTGGAPVTPCGSCRQSMLEYEIKQEAPIKVYLLSPSGEIIVVPSISQLLPLHFDAKNLKRD